MTKKEINKIKNMLWIEYGEYVLSGSKDGFNEWYLNECDIVKE